MVDEADARLHEMFLMITAGEAAGIVESVPSCGFEAWRLSAVRYNSVKIIAELSASIAKFERDLKTFWERTDEGFSAAAQVAHIHPNDFRRHG